MKEDSDNRLAVFGDDIGYYLKRLGKVCTVLAKKVGALVGKAALYAAGAGSALSDRAALARAHREERQRIRQNGQMGLRGRVAGRLLLFILLASALYWAFVYFFADDVYHLLESIFGMTDFIVGLYFSTEGWILIFICYFLLLLIVVSSEISRLIKYLVRVNRSVAELLISEKEPAPLPASLRELDTNLRGLRYTVMNERRVAREAEQRKSDLVMYLAHDLRTPLSSVIGYLTLLDESPELPAEQRSKFAGIALDKAYRLEDLINEFFDITRFNIQSVELSRGRTDLSMMLRQICDEFYPVLEAKGVEAQLRLPEELIVMADGDKLSRVFDNILRNAASYCYPNTPLFVRAYADGENAVVCFKNLGDEIPPEKLDRLFEKFFRADSARHSSSAGAGLGLAIAKQLIELHGGQIFAASSAEKTEFTVILPMNVSIS